MTVTLNQPAPAFSSVAAGNTRHTPTTGKNAAREQAVEFEATFLTSMLESMFAGVEISKPFGGGNAEQQFRSVLLGEYANTIAQAGGIGVADHVYREILALQEGKV